MTTPAKYLLAKLIKISVLDASLARIAAEKKRWETDLAGKLQLLKLKRDESDKRVRLAEEKKSVCRKEEKRLKDERTKLNERRQALASFNNYKTQQAAEREIDHNLRQLGGQEELLLNALVEIEKIEGDLAQLSESITSLAGNCEKLELEARENITQLEERQRDAQSQRDALVVGIEREPLATYDKVRTRYVTDPLVMIKNNTCSGCFMAIVPQMIVEIAKGESLVRCRGCGRILILEEPKEEQGG